MRLFRSAILIAVGLGLLLCDAGESWRAGRLSIGSAHASHHHHRRHHHRRHHPRRHHHRAPQTEM